MIINVLERALIFLRLRLSLRDLFFFHFSLISNENIHVSNVTDSNDDYTHLVMMVEELETLTRRCVKSVVCWYCTVLTSAFP